MRWTALIRISSLLPLTSAAACFDNFEHARPDFDASVILSDAECSSGPLFDGGALAAFTPGPDAGIRCTPHCGQDRPERWRNTGLRLYPLGAVPSGACSPDTAACGLDIGAPCGQDPISTWFSVACTCENGSWSCAGGYRGGGLCP